MKELINEEIKRFILLSKYNTSKTASENSINEDNVRGAIDAGRGLLKALEADRALSGELRSEIEGLSKELSRYGGITTKEGKQLKTAEEILDAVKGGKLAPAELGRFNMTIFRETTNPAISKAIAQDIVKTPTFAKEFGSLERDQAKNLLRNRLKISDTSAETLMKEYESFKSLEDVKLVDDVKTAENLKAAEDVKVADEVKTAEDIKAADEDLKVGNEQKASKNLQKAEEYYQKTRELEEEITMMEAEKRFRENRDYLQKLKDEKPNVVLDWLRRNKILKWGKKLISWKFLKSLAIITGIGYGVWYIFFKDHGVSVECPEGMSLDPTSGRCVRSGGGGIGDTGGNETGTTPGKTETPIKFTPCKDIYKLGCTDDEGIIETAQECLGLNKTGLFDKETENAVFKAINKREFSKDDLPKMCKSKSTDFLYQL